MQTDEPENDSGMHQKLRLDMISATCQNIVCIAEQGMNEVGGSDYFACTWFFKAQANGPKQGSGMYGKDNKKLFELPIMRTVIVIMTVPRSASILEV